MFIAALQSVTITVFMLASTEPEVKRSITLCISKAIAVSSVSMLSVILSSNPVAWTSLLSSPGRMTIAAAQPAPTSLPVIAPSVKHVTVFEWFSLKKRVTALTISTQSVPASVVMLSSDTAAK